VCLVYKIFEGRLETIPLKHFIIQWYEREGLIKDLIFWEETGQDKLFLVYPSFNEKFKIRTSGKK